MNEAENLDDRTQTNSGAGVLPNLRGVTDLDELAGLEAAELIRVVGNFRDEFGPGHRFTAADIRRMHREWLGDIYPWAGEYRWTPLSRERVRFASPARIPALMEELERLALEPHTPCAGPADQAAIALAVVHTELALIHPFPDGNSRVARLLAELMARQSGLPVLDFSLLDGGKQEIYSDALWAGVGRNYEPMTQLFREIIRRSATFEGTDRR